MHSGSFVANSLVRKTAVCQKLGLTRSGLDKLRSRDPSFPKPIKSSERRQSAAYFVAAEVDAWLQRKVAERDADNGVAA